MDEYLKAMFECLYKEDGLCVVARGLGVRELFSKFIRAFSYSSFSPSKEGGGESEERRRIVLCLNALEEAEAVKDTLRADGEEESLLPAVIRSEISSGERSVMYNKGGVFIASSRIIINDLLKGIVEACNVCGVLVFNAHKVSETSIESFILRVVKQGNRMGFVKAFSDEPEKILGFGKTERLMQLLFVKQLYLWPRFHFTINTTLSSSQPEVIELSQPLSPGMKSVQSSILVALETILKELRKSNTHIDPATLTLENGVFQSFSDSIRAQLEPEWHKISFHVKQLVTDLKTLRQLLDTLLRYDAVTFYSYLLTVKESHLASGLSSPPQWLTSSVADSIFKNSKDRVFNSIRVAESDAGSNFAVEGQKFCPVCEIPPKWMLVKDILKEIKSNVITEKGVPSSIISSRRRVVVIVKDDRTLLQLRDYLEADNNGADVIENRLRHFLSQSVNHMRHSIRGKKRSVNVNRGVRSAGNNKNSKYNKPSAARGSSTVSSESQLTEDDFERLSKENKMIAMLERELHNIPFGQVFQKRNEGDGVNRKRPLSNDTNNDNDVEAKKRIRPGDSENLVDGDESDESENEINLEATLLDGNTHIILLTHSQCVDNFNPLNDIAPSFVVLVDPAVSIIRLIETFQANQYAMRKDSQEILTKVYFLMYEESIEQHRYITSLKNEKKSFEDLIKKKSHMVITLPDVPGGASQHNSLAVDSRTQRRGAGNQNSISRVVVDIREFGSSLPSLLHLHQIRIYPVTLLVGDFILSPQICIERKGISDLFQSFASGRLYSQAESMCRYYDLPCLLVEFTENNSFSLQGQADISDDIQSNNICSKISLLVLAFPNLRILWSRNPHATVDIFKALKTNFEEADVDRAVQIGSDGTSSAIGSDDSAGENVVLDILLSLPGINRQNFRSVTENVDDIAQLSTMSVEKLTPLVGPLNAKKFPSGHGSKDSKLTSIN